MVESGKGVCGVGVSVEDEHVRTVDSQRQATRRQAHVHVAHAQQYIRILTTITITTITTTPNPFNPTIVVSVIMITPLIVVIAVLRRAQVGLVLTHNLTCAGWLRPHFAIPVTHIIITTTISVEVRIVFVIVVVIITAVAASRR